MEIKWGEIITQIAISVFSGGIVSAVISLWINLKQERNRRTFDVRYQRYTETLSLIEEIARQQEQYSKKSFEGIKEFTQRIFKGENTATVLNDYHEKYLIPLLSETQCLLDRLNNNFLSLKLICSEKLYKTINQYIPLIKRLVIEKTPQWNRKLLVGEMSNDDILQDVDVKQAMELSQQIPALMREDMRKYLEK